MSQEILQPDGSHCTGAFANTEQPTKQAPSWHEGHWWHEEHTGLGSFIDFFSDQLFYFELRFPFRVAAYSLFKIRRSEQKGLQETRRFADSIADRLGRSKSKGNTPPPVKSPRFTFPKNQ